MAPRRSGCGDDASPCEWASVSCIVHLTRTPNGTGGLRAWAARPPAPIPATAPASFTHPGLWYRAAWLVVAAVTALPHTP